MKILVTGGAGFIGSHIVDSLIEAGHEVVVLDNLSSGREENVHREAHLEKADITDFKAVQKIFALEKPEVVYHLAAQIDVRQSVADPITDAETNILGSIHLIKTAHESGVKKFIFSSTGGAIYGDTDDRPTPETHPEWPLSPYGIAKLAIDKYLNYFSLVHGLNFTSLRYANVYGPRQNPHGEAGVVAIFMDKMLAGTQPIINGDGRQTRDYVYVGDVARANLLALEHMDKNGVYNVGTGRETSVNELFTAINDCFDGTFRETHGDAKPGEQKTSGLDATKIITELGWKAEVAFSDGIKQTFDWFKGNARQS